MWQNGYEWWNRSIYCLLNSSKDKVISPAERAEILVYSKVTLYDLLTYVKIQLYIWRCKGLSENSTWNAKQTNTHKERSKGMEQIKELKRKFGKRKKVIIHIWERQFQRLTKCHTKNWQRKIICCFFIQNSCQTLIRKSSSNSLWLLEEGVNIKTYLPIYFVF